MDGSGDAPFIQAAIDSSMDGDLVLVGPGTYFEHLNFKGKDIWLKSFAGPEVTILDGNWAEGTVVLFESGETRDAIIEGFTITHGTGEWASTSPEVQNGGGLKADDSWPTIRGNIFVDNHPGGLKNGGGGMVFSSFPDRPDKPILIEGNLFLDNLASNGGGLLVGADAEIYNNVFIRNTTDLGDGGGILAHITSGATVTIRGNQFWENSAEDHGGAIEVGGAGFAMIESNLFVRNYADGSGGAANRGAGGAVSVRPFDVVIRNNTFWANIGYGNHVCRGGAILLDSAAGSPKAIITHNILAECVGCAIRVVDEQEIDLEDNLFWNNVSQDVFDNTGSIPAEWQTLNAFEDPQFCGSDADNFTVAKDSPALTHPNGPIGAFTSPGCGPGVPVERTTWGTLKMMFGENE